MGNPTWINWCEDGDYIISLGVPFGTYGNDFDSSLQEQGFWSKTMLKAVWHDGALYLDSRFTRQSNGSERYGLLDIPILGPGNDDARRKTK